MQELAFTTISEVAPRLASRDVSPVELTRACLDQIDRLDGQVNAFITVLADSAMDEARTAEAEIQRGEYRGPLHGIPIAHKDLLYTRGVRTTAGSSILADFVPDRDATVVSKLRAAGTILLGKLNLHEFAAGGTSNNPHYGAVHNPWRLEHHPGGSSGGSAAALATGMCLAASGSDTAGSIRIPSHCCGTTGIKPTYGRVSCAGVVPLSWSLDHVGPMTRAAADAALVLNAMAGFDRADSATVDRPAEDFAAQLNEPLRGLRIGVPTTYFTEPLQPEVDSAWRAAIQTLVQLGAIPVDIRLTQLDRATSIGMTVLRCEMVTFHQRWHAEQPEAYGPLNERFEFAGGVGAVDFVQAQRDREPIRAELWSVFDRVDVLVTPTMPTTAGPIDSDLMEIDGVVYNTIENTTRFTYPFNLSGFPAVSVPCGFDHLGLPIGLQLAGPPWREALLLRAAHQYQQATDWHQRRPVALETSVR
ncbi:MAG: amidase [Chloroflexi bacterium]|nr:amidase [Chloroflexota bacterium]MBV9897632.1 amidase [Chloroflexota bacterium]